MEANNIGDTRNRIDVNKVAITAGTPVTAGTLTTTATPAQIPATAVTPTIARTPCSNLFIFAKCH
jgi:hypothetical protein